MLQAAIAALEKAAAHGVDIGTLAIKEAARPQGIAVTLVGMRTPEEVRSVPSSMQGALFAPTAQLFTYHTQQTLKVTEGQA